MQLDKLTIKSQEALSQAQSQAGSRGHGAIEPAHLLGALLGQPEGATVPVLQKLGVSIDQLMGELEALLQRAPKVSGAGVQARMSDGLSRVLQRAFDEADQLKDEYVSTEHLLLAIAADPKEASGALLALVGATRDTLLQALQSVRGGARVTDQE